jgi:hypothetical protein
MVTGRGHRKTAVRVAGHGRLGYPTSNSGLFEEKEKFT